MSANNRFDWKAWLGVVTAVIALLAALVPSLNAYLSALVLAALLSILSVLCVYMTVQRLGKGRAIAILSSAIFTIVIFLILQKTMPTLQSNSPPASPSPSPSDAQSPSMQVQDPKPDRSSNPVSTPDDLSKFVSTGKIYRAKNSNLAIFDLEGLSKCYDSMFKFLSDSPMNKTRRGF